MTDSNCCDDAPEGRKRDLCLGIAMTTGKPVPLRIVNQWRAKYGCQPLERTEPPVGSQEKPVSPPARQPKPVKTATPATGGPCPFRSEMSREMLCDLCGGGLKKGQPFQAFWCALHACDCSLARHHSKVRSCGVCVALGENVSGKP